MGWRVTVKAGRVCDMKNKRKTGGKTGKSAKKRWVGGELSEQQKKKYKCFPNPTPDLLCNYDKNRYQNISPFKLNNVLNRNIASYVPVSYLYDEHKVAELTELTELTAWYDDLDNDINCGNYDIHNPNRQPYNLNAIKIIKPGDFILSEAPIPDKFYDFWDIVITKKIDVIVMLTNLIEKKNQKNQLKADKYFPDSNNTLLFNGITVVSTTHNVDKNFEISTFTVNKNDLSHTVKHLWYKVWPDHGVVDINAFKTLIQTYYAHTNDASKTLVHCSAGVGRTGTFVAALLYCRFQKQINIDNIILFLRKCRMWQVQTEEQYALLIENQDTLPQRSDVAAATVAAAANPSQPAVAAAAVAVAATKSSVPAGTHTLVMNDGSTKQVHISATPVAHSNQHAALLGQLHYSLPEQHKRYDNNYAPEPKYANYAAPKDNAPSYSNNRYKFIFDLPVFLYPKPAEYDNLSRNILNGTTNMYILRPCRDQQLHHFVITWINTNGIIMEKTILFVDNNYLKLEDQWRGPIGDMPKHYNDLFHTLIDIIKLGLNETIQPLKIYKKPYTYIQNVYLGLTPPTSFPPSIVISPINAEAGSLAEAEQYASASTLMHEKDIGVAQPAAGRAAVNPDQPAAVDAAFVQPTTAAAITTAATPTVSTAAPVMPSAQDTTETKINKVGVPAPATAPADVTEVATAAASSTPPVADNPNPTAPRGISADDDGKEDTSTLPARGKIPTINNSPSHSNQPAIVKAAVISGIAKPSEPPSFNPLDLLKENKNTLNIVPNRTVPQHLYELVNAVITNESYTNDTKLFSCKINGTPIIAQKSNTTPQEFDCTILSKPNLIAAPQ